MSPAQCLVLHGILTFLLHPRLLQWLTYLGVSLTQHSLSATLPGTLPLLPAASLLLTSAHSPAHSPAPSIVVAAASSLPSAFSPQHSGLQYSGRNTVWVLPPLSPSSGFPFHSTEKMKACAVIYKGHVVGLPCTLLTSRFTRFPPDSTASC